MVIVFCKPVRSKPSSRSCKFFFTLVILSNAYVYQIPFPAAKEEAKKFMTPPATPSKQATTSQQSTVTPDDVTRHVQMADVAGDVLRMRKIKQKLDSVLVSLKVPFFLYIQCNPVNTDTKVTYHSAPFYPGARIKWVLRKQRHGHIFYRYKDTKEQ